MSLLSSFSLVLGLITLNNQIHGSYLEDKWNLQGLKWFKKDV